MLAGVYRTAALPTPPDMTVTCAACVGQLPAVRAEAEKLTFRCPLCDLEQPTLPSELVADGKLVLVGSDYGSYEQLVPFGTSLGETAKSSRHIVKCAGLTVNVSVSLNSGSVDGIDIEALAPGLPPMRLKREMEEHRDDKQAGVVKEVQTGDTAFDAAVFIETEASDGDVLTMLASPAVRAAIMKLWEEGVSEITVTSTALSIKTSRELPYVQADRLGQYVQLLRIVAAAPRPLAVTIPPLPLGARIARIPMFTASPLGIGLMILGGKSYTPVNAGPVILSLAVGLLLAIISFAAITRLLGGRSTSRKEIGALKGVALIAVPMITAGAVLVLNGALDRSPERLVEMEVVSTSKDDDDSSIIHAKTVAPDGGKHDFPFAIGDGEDLRGRVVRARWRSGALGIVWESGQAVLLPKRPTS